MAVTVKRFFCDPKAVFAVPSLEGRALRGWHGGQGQVLMTLTRQNSEYQQLSTSIGPVKGQTWSGTFYTVPRTISWGTN